MLIPPCCALWRVGSANLAPLVHRTRDEVKRAPSRTFGQHPVDDLKLGQVHGASVVVDSSIRPHSGQYGCSESSLRHHCCASASQYSVVSRVGIISVPWVGQVQVIMGVSYVRVGAWPGEPVHTTGHNGRASAARNPTLQAF